MKFNFKKPEKINIGWKDRVARVVIGLLLLVGVYNGGSWIVGLIGLVLIVTAYFRFCPAYLLFDVNTHEDDVSAGK